MIRSDGQFVRDYFYVEDGAAAYMLLAEQLGRRPELRGQAFNFSNEMQITVLELVKRILRADGLATSSPTIRNEASNEIHHQYLSAAKRPADAGLDAAVHAGGRAGADHRLVPGVPAQ